MTLPTKPPRKGGHAAVPWYTRIHTDSGFTADCWQRTISTRRQERSRRQMLGFAEEQEQDVTRANSVGPKVRQACDADEHLGQRTFLPTSDPKTRPLHDIVMRA